MNRSALVTVVLAVLFLAAAVGWWLQSDPRAPVVTGGPVADGAPGTATDAVGIAEAAGTRLAPDLAGTARERVAVTPVDTRDPDIVAALSGFEGRLVDSEGGAVPDALVELFRFAADSVITPDVHVMLDAARCEPDIDAGQTRSGQDGRFRIDGVFPRGFFLLEAGGDGDLRRLLIVERNPNPGEVVDLGDIVLDTLGVITGTVLDADGEPLAGALVRATDLPGSALAMFPAERFDPEGGVIVSEDVNVVVTCPPWVKRRFDQLPFASTLSGADGSFRLAGVVPGGNLVAITARGHLSNVRPRVVVEAGEVKDIGSLRMREGESLYGRVVDETGKPIAGAQVLVAAETPTAPVHFASFAAPTDSDGRFEFAGLPSGNAVCAARRGPGQPWQLGEMQPVTRDAVITLGSRHTLTIALRSEAGVAIESPRFQLLPGARSRGAVEMSMWGIVDPVDLTDRVVLRDDGRWTISDLPKGSFVLLASAPRHAIAALDVDLQRDAEHELALRAHDVFEVRVVGATGEPVRSARVYAETTGEPRFPEMPIHAGDTDAKGSLVVDRVTSNKVRLSASHPAWGVVHGETALPAPAPIVLRFEAPGAIAGIVVDGGQKPALGKWFVAADRSWDGTHGAMPDMPRMASPDAEGRFVLRGLRPGKYRLSIQESLHALKSPGGFMGFMTSAFMRSDPADHEVEVVADQTTDVVLDASRDREVTGPSALVTGTVIVDGRPATDMMISGWTENRRLHGEIDAAGRFDLGRVPAGDIHLNLMDKPSGDLFASRRFDSLWSTSLQIEDGKDRDLDIDIQTSSLRGSVATPDGAPAAGASVSLNGHVEEGGTTRYMNFSTSAERDGSFEFARIPAATYSLTADSDKIGRGHLAGIVVAPGLPTTGVHVRMARVVVVSGSVDLTALGTRKPRWMWLQFARETSAEHDHGGTRWVHVEENGNFTTDELTPGSYRVEFHANGTAGEDESGEAVRGVQLHHEGVVTIGTADVSGLRIVPVARAGR